MRYEVLRPAPHRGEDEFDVDSAGDVADRRALLLLAHCVFTAHRDWRVADDDGNVARSMADANRLWGRHARI